MREPTTAQRIRLCPNCNSERPLAEMMCGNDIGEGQCGHLMVSVQPSYSDNSNKEPPLTKLETNSYPQTVPELRDIKIKEKPQEIRAGLCSNGHEVDAEDEECLICGELIAHNKSEGSALSFILPEWQVICEAPTVAGAEQRVVASHITDGHKAVVTIFREGAEPDQAVYDVLRKMDINHIARIEETGRYRNNAYEITEYIPHGSLRDLKIDPSDLPTIKSIIEEVALALLDFNRVGLRHRDLTPNVVTIRTLQPLDLVIEGFGSSCLSEYDLDVVSPLENTIYMAPEAIAGGVAASSDWWSLGMILLEKLAPDYFKDVNPKAFLINALTAGVEIPNSIDPVLTNLLSGLLLRNREYRFGFDQVRSWLDGEVVPVAVELFPEDLSGPTITLGDQEIDSLQRYALTAAEEYFWDEARGHLSNGRLATWAEESGLDSKSLAQLRATATREINQNFKLGIALKILNKNMPFVQVGEIVGPSWLLENPELGYELISSETSYLLEDLDMEPWIVRLKERANAVRQIAKTHGVELDEEAAQINLLSTSRARLLANWEQRRSLFPDTENLALASILDKKKLAEEDLIVLLSADIGQFQSLEDIISKATALAGTADLSEFKPGKAREVLATQSRQEIFRDITDRTTNFARCGNEKVDGWVDNFRLERRTTLPKALIMLEFEKEKWSQAPDQIYVSDIIKFFETKVHTQINQGPLARMRISKSSPRIDLFELNDETEPAELVLNKILERTSSKIDIGNRTVMADELLPSRIRKLVQNSILYHRETGINGLQLGFPFVVIDTGKKGTKPRIAPILLWPVKMTATVGYNAFSLSFDTDRQEVQLNPALESYFGPREMERWHRTADDLLAGSVTLNRAMDEFGKLGNPITNTIHPLPNSDVQPKVGQTDIYPTGVLFLMTFMGQAIIKDLQALNGTRATDTALGAMLRLTKNSASNDIKIALQNNELDQYLVAKTDPSQEEAVKFARNEPGTLIKGPPGTGKSQTLTHIVADCLGRGESVLICTQKQAALEVVRKRLVAEGLQSRVVMVQDVNKDRRSVIKSIREHQESVRQSSDRQERLMTERRQLAAKISGGERELDENHKVLFEPIGKTGRSYRDVITELLTIEDTDKNLPVDCPEIRSIVQYLPIDDLVNLEERVAPLVPLWLEAEPQKSANTNLLSFGWEKSKCDMYRKQLKALFQSEQKRFSKHPRAQNSFTIEDVERARIVVLSCLRTYPKNLKDRIHLAKWVDFFNSKKDGAIGQGLINNLVSMGYTLNGLDMTRHSDKFSSNLLEQKRPHLEYIQSNIEQYLKQSVLKVLNPVWWLARKRVRNIVRQHTLEVIPPLVLELSDAVAHELDLFNIRQSLLDITKQIDFNGIKIKRVSGNELISEISNLISLLQTAQEYEHEVRGAPNWEKFKLALTDHSGLELHEYVVALNKSLERYDDIESSLQLLNPVQEWLSDEAVKIITDQIITDEKSGLSLVTNLFSQSNKVELFQRYRHTIGKEEFLIGNFFEKLNSVRNSLIILKSAHGSAVRRIINREVRLAWKQEAEETSTGLLLDQQEIRQKVQTLSQYIKEMRELNRLYLQERYERDKHARSTDWESITRLTGARSLRLREFISRGSSFGLFDLKPVWLMNPDVAARMLPLIKGLFDVVVFDEASQLPVEHSLHVLYRGKRVIISGDEKQMPPTAFFQSKIETEEAELEGGLADDDATDEEIEALEMVANSRDIKDCTNLLNLASSTLHTQVLKVHYRSKFRELIAFSNASFYQNSLHIPVRHPSSLTAFYKPIEYIEVNGVYKDQQNPAEAAAIVNRLQEFWEKAGDSRPSVGIVTFNRKQANLIQEYIEKRAEIDSKFRVCLSEENTRYVDGEDMSFFVKNVENVQGDERDVILFSSTFGKNEHGRFRRFFGVLGAMGGERRLNVAVTRAREKIMFFTSMPVSDVSDFINVKRPPNTPRDYLQGYLQYAKLVSLGEFDRATALTNQLLDGGSNVDHAHEFNEDGFIQIVSNFIFECGFTSIIARETTAFSLDILIKNPETGQFSLGIECDAPQHNLLASARSREIWRPEILRLGIPYIHRVSSINWYTSRESEKKLLRQAITSAFRKELK